MEKDLKLILNEALQDSNIAWWEWDIQKNLVISNDLKTAMLGYKPEDFRDVSYQTYTDLLHPDDYERTMKAMRDHLEGHAPIYQVDYRIRRVDGTYTWYMDRGSIIERDSEGHSLKLRGIVLDLGKTFHESTKNKALVYLIRRSLPVPGEDSKLLVLCSACKNIKLTKSSWMPVDSTFERSLAGKISYSICPNCIELLYPDEAARLLKKVDCNQ